MLPSFYIVAPAYASFESLLKAINDTILNPLIVLLFALALVFFLYGVVEYLFLYADNDEARKKGRSHIVWGLVGMLIMFGAFTIIKIIIATLGVSGIDVDSGGVTL